MEIRSRILSFGIGNHCLCNFGFSHLSNGASHQKRHFSRLDVPAVRSSGVFIPTRHVYNVVFDQCDVVGGMGWSVRFKIHRVDNVHVLYYFSGSKCSRWDCHRIKSFDFVLFCKEVYT